VRRAKISRFPSYTPFCFLRIFNLGLSLGATAFVSSVRIRSLSQQQRASE
jgi:hypothetical protein